MSLMKKTRIDRHHQSCFGQRVLQLSCNTGRQYTSGKLVCDGVFGVGLLISCSTEIACELDGVPPELSVTDGTYTAKSITQLFCCNLAIYNDW